MDGYLEVIICHSCPVTFEPWVGLPLNLGSSWDECPIGTLLATALTEHRKRGAIVNFVEIRLLCTMWWLSIMLATAFIEHDKWKVIVMLVEKRLLCIMWFLWKMIIVEKKTLLFFRHLPRYRYFGSSHSSNKDRIGMVGAGPSLPLQFFDYHHFSPLPADANPWWGP